MSVSQRVLLLAILRIPLDHRDRCREEWEADLLSYDGEWSRLFRALDLCRADWGFGEAIVSVSDPESAIVSQYSERLEGTGMEPPKTFLEYMGQRLAGACTEEERKELARSWHNGPEDHKTYAKAKKILDEAGKRLGRPI